MPSDADRWLDKVYGAESADQLMVHYEEWAATYERDLFGTGYRLPAIAAGLVCRFLADKEARILDAGCGTGLIAEALAPLGYRNLEGLDLSDSMLAVAGQKGLYKATHLLGLGPHIDLPDETFDAVISFGVLTLGHAPPESLVGMVRIAKPGGVLIFSVSTPALAEGGYSEMLQKLAEASRWTPLEATEPFRSMPYSKTEGHLTHRVFAYRKS